MSKYHTLVAIEPVGNQELDVVEFIQESSDTEDNVVYLYVSGDSDIPTLHFDNLPMCEHEIEALANDEDCDCTCKYGASLVHMVIKHYEDLGFSVSIVNMGSFVSPLG